MQKVLGKMKCKRKMQIGDEKKGGRENKMRKEKCKKECKKKKRKGKRECKK